MKKLLKDNMFYVVIFIICIIIMILYTLNQTNVFSICKNFIFNSNFRENFSLAESEIKIQYNLVDVFVYVISDYMWRFDYMIIFGTNLFQLILPFFTATAGLYFYKKYNTLYKMSLTRVINFKSFIKKEILNDSLKMAITMFTSYMCLFLILYIICGGKFMDYMGRELYLDILGHGFYDKHVYLYYIMDGFARFFFMPFVYTYFACTVATIFSSKKSVFFISNIYYYGLAVIAFGLYNIIGQKAIYLNPTVIMASGSYTHVNTLLLFLINVIPILASYIYLTYYNKREI